MGVFPLTWANFNQSCNELNKNNSNQLDCRKENILSSGETRENGKIVVEVIQLKDGTTIRKYNGTTFICKDNNCQQRN